jgi:hypothetical protein
MKTPSLKSIVGLLFAGVTDQEFSLGGGKSVSVPDADPDTVSAPAPEQAAVPAEVDSAPAPAPEPAAAPRPTLRQQVGEFPPVANLGRELVECVAQFRTYEQLRACDLVDGAERRKKAIEAELSSGDTTHPIQRVRELQDELARLGTVTPGTEFEVLRELRRRASKLADSSIAWLDLAVETAERHLAERQQHQNAFFQHYGLTVVETGICREALELIRELRNFRATIDLEVNNRPELMNADDVANRGAMPLYRSRPQSRTPGVQAITSALSALGIDVSPIRRASARI